MVNSATKTCKLILELKQELYREQTFRLLEIDSIQSNTTQTTLADVHDNGRIVGTIAVQQLFTQKCRISFFTSAEGASVDISPFRKELHFSIK